MASRVVIPETKRLPISNGDWLVVKKRLNHGERQEAFARGYTMSETGYVPKLLIVDTVRVTAYLVDWSLMGPDDLPLVIRGQSADVVQSMIDSLDPDSVKEISDAIKAHVAAMDAERDEEKKTSTGSEVSGPTLVSAGR